MNKHLKDLERWCARESGLRLKMGPPLPNTEIKKLPGGIASSNIRQPLDVPFQPKSFVIPISYRQFLSEHSFARLEYMNEDEQWEVYEPFNIFSPEEVVKGLSFTPSGTELDDKPICSTFLIAFATAGYQAEASRWCFYTDKDIPAKRKGELPILSESNDFECDVAKYVETRKWVEKAMNMPAAYSFDEWLSKLVSMVTSKPFDPERTDEIPNGFYAKKK